MIYLASSWKNERQPSLVKAIREAGHEVYDFRNPAPGDNGFSWREIIDVPRPWFLETSRSVLTHPIAETAFQLDKKALDKCEIVVMLLPCGNDSHLEAGYAAGKGKLVIVYADDNVKFEPSLMWKIFSWNGGIVVGEPQLLETLNQFKLIKSKTIDDLTDS